MKPTTAAALSGLVALAVAMGVGRFAFTPILPMMQSDAGIGMVEGGWLASANYVGYFAGALSALALPVSAGAATRVGLLIVGAATLAMGHTAHMGAWLALRLLAGVASAWVLVFASAWCLDQFQHAAPASRAQLGATLFAGVGTGIAIAGALCLALIVRGAGSAGAWTLLGALSLVAALGLPRGFGASPPQAAAATAPQGRWPPDSARLILCYGAFGFGYIIPATFISTMARDLVRDPALYGWSWPIFGAAAAASTFGAAALRRHLSDRHIWMAGHVAMAAGVVVPVVSRGAAGIVACALLVGGTFMVVTMVGMQEARRVSGMGARRLMAAMTSAFAAGQIAGPLAVSALVSAGVGYDAALIAAGVALVASALALASPPRENTP